MDRNVARVELINVRVGLRGKLVKLTEFCIKNYAKSIFNQMFSFMGCFRTFAKLFVHLQLKRLVALVLLIILSVGFRGKVQKLTKLWLLPRGGGFDLKCPPKGKIF